MSSDISIKVENLTKCCQIYDQRRDRLKQIIVNLLINAVKFTPDHRQVHLQVVSDLEQGFIQFSVIDTGIGIAPADMKK